MVKLAQTDPAVAISMDVLDTNKWLLNCANGTVDLKTGELRAADRGDMITKTTGIGFDPDAVCPKWEAFILWTMKDRPDMVTFLQRALGMSLTGDTCERPVFFLHGGVCRNLE